MWSGWQCWCFRRGFVQYSEKVSEAQSGVFQLQGSGGVPGDGPYITLKARVERSTSRIVTVEAIANGCPSSIRMGLVLETFLPGRLTSQILALDRADLRLLFGDLPEGKDYVLDLALQAVSRTLNLS